MRLANQLVRFDFDEETGSLRQITDLTTGRRVLNDRRGNRLAKLIVPTPEHSSRPLYSHEAGQPKMTRRGDTLEIEFPELQSREQQAGVFLTVTMRLPESEPEALFSAAIRNESPYRVHELWFPWLGGRKGKPGQRRDLVTTSKAADQDIYAQLYRMGASTHTFGHHHLRLSWDTIHLLPMMDLSEVGQASHRRPSPLDLRRGPSPR